MLCFEKVYPVLSRQRVSDESFPPLSKLNLPALSSSLLPSIDHPLALAQTC